MDIQLHYLEAGEGFPLILLHGNGENCSYFEHQIDYFSEQYRVIAVDTRGHGMSPRGEAPFTIRQFAWDLFDLMNELEIPKAHILGFSDGGNIALCFALAHPERVEKLIVNGANLYPAGVKTRDQRETTRQYYEACEAAEYDPDAWQDAEMLGLMVNDPYIRPRSLRKLHMPVLVIAGTNDVIKTGHTKYIAKCIPHSRLEFIEGDHFIAASQPEIFNAIVDDFLSEY